jgi:hypothetical protein
MSDRNVTLLRLAPALAVLLAATAASAAAPASKPDPAPAAAPAEAPAAPGEVAFDALIGHVGEHVRVTTTLGTVREGELTGASSIAINVRLDDRGIVLGMPRETIVKVELVAATATPAGEGE